MKVAFATDDKITISRMTGRAKFFAIYTLEDGEIKDVEYLENNHTHDHDHGHEHHHSDNHSHEHNHHHGENDGKGDGKGRNHHSGHSHKKVLVEMASRNVLFITRHLGKHFKDGVVELGIDYRMTKEESIEDALKNI